MRANLAHVRQTVRMWSHLTTPKRLVGDEAEKHNQRDGEFQAGDHLDAFVLEVDRTSAASANDAHSEVRLHSLKGALAIGAPDPFTGPNFAPDSALTGFDLLSAAITVRHAQIISGM